MSISQDVLVQVDHLSKFFQISRNQTLKAVNDVSFSIRRGETVGLVGESGCGKTTTGRCLVKLYEPTEGHVYYKGQDISQLNKAQMHEFTGNVQMIFQNPYSSLNPRMTVQEIIEEGLKVRGMKDEAKRRQMVFDILDKVGLTSEHATRYPHEFSGGQRQRIGIARALIVNPSLIIADEPVSALDVSVQAQVINLLSKLKEEMNLTIIFIAHNLSVVKYFSDRIAVMYYGKIVELTTCDELYRHPLHPYTVSLLSAVPQPNPLTERERQRITYVPAQDHDYSVEKPYMQEVIPGHFVFCSDSECAKYREQLAKEQ